MQAVPLFAGWLPQYPAGPVSDVTQTDVVLKLPGTVKPFTYRPMLIVQSDMSASQTELYLD